MTRWLVLANIVALAVAVVWLAVLTLPTRQAVRVRNAFLLRRGRPEEFAWTPTTVPADFKVESRPAPGAIAAAVEAAEVAKADGDWQRALLLVGMLVRHARHEGGIRSDLATTYRGIVAGHGYCTDYVRVFMAAAAASGLFCRQWAFSFDGFGGHGHTFVEVFDRQRSAWAFLDVHNNVYAVRAGTNVPLDALALRAALLGAPSEIEFRRAAPGRLGFPHANKLLDYYERGAAQWYLWWGNDVVSRDQDRLVSATARISGRLAQGVQSVLGRLPPLVALATSDNEREIAGMERLRRQVLAASIVCAGLAASLAMQAGWLLAEPRHA
jgi:hypothetical protein